MQNMAHQKMNLTYFLENLNFSGGFEVDLITEYLEQLKKINLN